MLLPFLQALIKVLAATFRRSAYPVHVALDEILAASFPNPGDKERLRQMITDDFGVNALGINGRRDGGKVMDSFPMAIFEGVQDFFKDHKGGLTLCRP